MYKKYAVLTLVCALLLSVLSGCSPSPTAVTVGDNKVDASEYAFYLHYHRLSTGEDSGTLLYDEEDTAEAKAAEGAVAKATIAALTRTIIRVNTCVTKLVITSFFLAV